MKKGTHPSREKWTKDSPRCRSCFSPKSPRSTIFCEHHLEQATRYARARADAEKGNGKWAHVSADAAESMREMRRRGDSLNKIARAFGYSMATICRHVCAVPLPSRRGKEGWR